GQRIAYEAAQSSGLDPAILGFFEIYCIKNDPGWYIENANLTRDEITDRQAGAFQDVLPLLPQLLDESAVKDYITAPMLDEKATERYVMGLPKFEHNVLRGERCDKAKLGKVFN
ncbi:hypothetical protein GE09DRAFT_982227, partial [Coniochaeta sp. 2T2.1]